VIIETAVGFRQNISPQRFENTLSFSESNMHMILRPVTTEATREGLSSFDFSVGTAPFLPDVYCDVLLLS
jgi:hypothetical protein